MPNVTVEMNDVYIPYLNRDEKFQCFYGGSGSGKSRFICQKIVLMCLQEQRKFLVLRNTYASIRQSVFTELKTVIYDMQLHSIVKIREYDMTIEFVTGSSIIFKGLDDVEKIKSISGITDVFIEEASEVTNKDIFDQLVLRIRVQGVKPHFFLSWNPVDATHWLKTFVDEELPMKDGFFLKTTYIHNRFLNPDYIENLEQLKETNPHFWRIYGLGEWSSTSKRIYNNWEVIEFNEHEILKSYPKIKPVFGLDFGYVTSSTAFVHALVSEETKELWICPKYLYQTGMLNNEIAQWIMANGYGKEEIFADCAEQKSIQQIKNEGVRRIKPCRKGKDSVMSGITYISQYKMYVHPECVDIITELQNYSFKKDKDGNYLNEPVPKFDHALDALRYGMQELIFKNGKVKVFSKSVLGL